MSFREIVEQVYCSSPTECELLAQSELFPEGFRPVSSAAELLVPDVDKQKKEPNSFQRALSSWFGKE